MKRAYYFFIQKVVPRVLGKVFKGICSMLSLTYKYECHGFHEFNQGTGRKILALWHQKLFIIPPILQKFTPFSYAALVSKSKDGEILSQVIESYKRGSAIRIAHNAKSAGLVGSIDAITKENKVLVITPDGPRGPSKEVKGGIFTIAKNAEALIYPLNWSSDTCWRLGTWDKMEIPKPFSKIRVVIGKALEQDEDLKERIDSN